MLLFYSSGISLNWGQNSQLLYPFSRFFCDFEKKNFLRFPGVLNLWRQGKKKQVLIPCSASCKCWIHSRCSHIWDRQKPNFNGIWEKVFNNGSTKNWGRETAWANHIPSKFLKAVFHKFYLVHSWILCFICRTEVF